MLETGKLLTKTFLQAPTKAKSATFFHIIIKHFFAERTTRTKVASKRTILHSHIIHAWKFYQTRTWDHPWKMSEIAEQLLSSKQFFKTTQDGVNYEGITEHQQKQRWKLGSMSFWGFYQLAVLSSEDFFIYNFWFLCVELITILANTIYFFV